MLSKEQLSKVTGRVATSSGYHLRKDNIWLKAGRRTSRLYEAEQKAARQIFRGRVELIKK